MSTPRDLVGRDAECFRLERLHGDLLRGNSATLVLRGEVGIGKTALLNYIVDISSSLHVSEARGIESDMELPYAGLHQLCGPFLDGIPLLPAPQAEAIRVAFGISRGEAPERFLVGLAVLTLWAKASETRPLLLVVDDAQWLDRLSAQTLEFVARRLVAEQIALVMAVRTPEGAKAFAGLDELWVRGLSSTATGALLDSAVDGPVDPKVRSRIVAETRGNPLAVLELCRGRSAVDLAYGLQQHRDHSIADQMVHDYARRISELPTATQQLLLLAAAEPVGDPSLLVRAANELGIAVDAAPATSAGLIEVGESIRFAHPLARAAAYIAADPVDRRSAHRALARATDESQDPDRKAWHFAQAADGPDEAVAAGLERAAGRARERGGMAAEAVLHERAAELTPDAVTRGHRALAAAEAHFSAAAPDRATELAAMADQCPMHPMDEARLTRLRARVLFARSRGQEAGPLLLDAAAQFSQLHSSLARDTYLEAISAIVFSGRVHGAHGAQAAALAARRSHAPASSSVAADHLLQGVSAILALGPRQGLPTLKAALVPFVEEQHHSREAALRWLLLTPVALESFIHHDWNLNAWEQISSRAVRVARDLGALGVLPSALIYAGGVKIHHGDFVGAAALLDEAEELTRATGQAQHAYGHLVLSAWRGDRDDAIRLIAAVRDLGQSSGEASLVAATGYVSSVLFNGLARYDQAVEAAGEAIAHDGFNFSGLSLVEHLEALTHLGRRDDAERSLARLLELTDATETGWARGARARGRALLSNGAPAATLFEEALDAFESARVRVEVARTHLNYGEWLRRNRRAALARDHLRTSFDMFNVMGARAFAERARRELLATGEKLAVPTPARVNQLTPQEEQIALLAASGLTNPQIGAELFISPHTVEWHLRKVYSKLDIASRKDLERALTSRHTSA